MSIVIHSTTKHVTSGTAPTTTSLPDGYLAFGTYAGVTTLWGNDGDVIKKLGAEPETPIVAVADVTYSGDTLTISYTSGDPSEINLPAENFLSAASYDATTHILTLTLNDDSTVGVNLSDLIDAYTAGTGLTLTGSAFSITAGGVTTAMLETALQTKLSTLFPTGGDGTAVFANNGSFQAINVVVDEI